MISVGHKYYNQISMACSNFVNIFVEDNIEERKKKRTKHGMDSKLNMIFPRLFNIFIKKFSLYFFLTYLQSGYHNPFDTEKILLSHHFSYLTFLSAIMHIF